MIVFSFFLNFSGSVDPTWEPDKSNSCMEDADSSNVDEHAEAEPEPERDMNEYVNSDIDR